MSIAKQSKKQIKSVQINFGCNETFQDSIHDEEPAASPEKKEAVEDLLSAFDAAGILSEETSAAASSKEEPEASPAKSKSESGGHHTKIKF